MLLHYNDPPRPNPQEGIAGKLLQTTPHLVLLDRAFYTARLRPLFAAWCLVWLADKGLAGLSHAATIAYLHRAGASSPPVLQVLPLSPPLSLSLSLSSSLLLTE